jgi:arginyl-tRNA synthetase
MVHADTMTDLTATLRSLGISKVPQLPNTSPALNPVDVYRSHITELLAPIAGVDPKIVYNALQWTQTLAMGDLILPVPALRVKGKKPDELAKEISEKVSHDSLSTSLFASPGESMANELRFKLQ